MSEQAPEGEAQPQETSTERYLREILGIDRSENPEYVVFDLPDDSDNPPIQ